MSVLTFDHIELNNKRVLIRQDLNVPVKDGKVTSDARIRASIPTLQRAVAAGARVMVMSHLGRPAEGEPDPHYSLRTVAEHLATLIATPVDFVENWIDGVEAPVGTITVLENVRFLNGEKKNDTELAKKMAALCDVYVMDAFGTAHRAQASTYGVAAYAPVACAGPLLQAELEALAQALDNPARPLVAIVGGSKVSTKLTVLESLSEKVDQLIVGGGIANTFIAAQGHKVGKSLYEADLVDTAQSLSANIAARDGILPVPTDVVCGKSFSESTSAELKAVVDVQDDDMIFDIGPESTAVLADIIAQAGTVVWNGPIGVFEFEQFSAGTQAISQAIAHSEAFSIAGGGDTLAAVDAYNIADTVSYISTGGGAFLEFLEGKKLPAVEILEKRAKNT